MKFLYTYLTIILKTIIFQKLNIFGLLKIFRNPKRYIEKFDRHTHNLNFFIEYKSSFFYM